MSSGEDMVIPDEVLDEAVAAVDLHWITEQKNLGYYRTECTCICGESWMSGEHEGDPDFYEQRERHRLTHAAQVVARWARDEALKEAEAAVTALLGEPEIYTSLAYSGVIAAQAAVHRVRSGKDENHA